MNIRLRIFCYFAAAFFPAFAGAHSAQTLADWLQAVSLAAGAGFTALVAYFDHTDHNDNNPPPLACPLDSPSLPMKTTRFFRILFALVISATLSACAGSAADNDFRSKVQEVDVAGNGGATADGAVTAGADAKFILRDPNQAPAPAATPASR